MTNFDRYAKLRQSSRVFRDGFERRVGEVTACLRAGFPHGRFRLLDVGTADGLMLSRLQDAFPDAMFVGIESLTMLVTVAREHGHDVVQSFAQKLPFRSESFDVVTLVSTLKHIPEYEATLSECRRVLVPGGHLVVSDPTPWGIRLGLLRRHFEKEYLPNVWSLHVAEERILEAGFEIERAYRYMPFPVEVTGSRIVESVGKTMGASGLFMQQLVHAKAR